MKIKSAAKYLVILLGYAGLAGLPACASFTPVNPQKETNSEVFKREQNTAERAERRKALCRNTVDDGSEDRGKIIRKNC